MFSKMLVQFLTFLCLTIPCADLHAAYAPVAPSMTVGGRTFTDLTNLIVLACYLGGGDSCTMRLGSGSSGYQVTAGKTLRITAIEVHNGAAGVGNCEPVYSNNDIGFAGSSASFTSPVYFAGGTSSSTFMMIQQTSSGGNNGHMQYPLIWDVPATKYPGIRCNAAILNAAFYMYGYEQ